MTGAFPPVPVVHSPPVDDRTPSWGITPVPERLQGLGTLDSLLLWGNLSVSLLVIVIGALSWALGMLGPIGFVRRYLRKVASWALLFAMGYLTYWAISRSHLHAFWNAPADPEKAGFHLSFGQAVDIVIASIVSWTPLA